MGFSLLPACMLAAVKAIICGYLPQPLAVSRRRSFLILAMNCSLTSCGASMNACFTSLALFQRFHAEVF